jgi:hypothetical protein
VFEPDSFRTLAYILFYDAHRSIRTAVVDQNVFPISITLPQDALNTFPKIVLGVVKRGYKTHEWSF